MDWNRLKIFYHVVKEGSMTQTAEKLRVEQSTISRHIAKLESELNIKAFDRSHARLRLTNKGEKLFEIAEKMVREASNIKNTLEEDKIAAKGELKIATTIALASMWLPYYMDGFVENYPDIRLTLIGDDNELDLNVKQADATIRPLLSHPQGYIQRYLTTFNLRLYASEKYLERYGTPQSIEDLDKHRLITFGDDTIHPYDDINWMLRLGRKDSEGRKAFLKINVGPGLLQMAEQGLGIVALSKEYLLINKLGLVNVLPEVEGPAVDVFYTYPQHSKGFKRIEALGDYLEEVCASDKDKRAYP